MIRWTAGGLLPSITAGVTVSRLFVSHNPVCTHKHPVTSSRAFTVMRAQNKQSSSSVDQTLVILAQSHRYRLQAKQTKKQTSQCAVTSCCHRRHSEQLLEADYLFFFREIIAESVIYLKCNHSKVHKKWSRLNTFRRVSIKTFCCCFEVFEHDCLETSIHV